MMNPPPGSGSYATPAKVVDASLLGAIIFQEPRAEEADKLIRGADLYAPGLLAYELTHIAQKKSHQYPSQEVALQYALEAALSMDIRWRDVDHVAVLRLALAHGITSYDASYLYLARALGLDLVTFDERLKAVQ